MRRFNLWNLGSVALIGVASVAGANDFWTGMKTDWHRNNMWPSPFVQADRAAVCEYFAIQTNNGWRLQNTIGDPYFDPATQELTMAGQHKVKWIVQQAPMHRRTVFVLLNENEEITSARMSSVQQAVARFTIKGTPAEVLMTDRDVFGGSGEYYDAIDRAMKSTVPAPRLPSGNSGGGGNGGGNGGGGSGGGGNSGS